MSQEYAPPPPPIGYESNAGTPDQQARTWAMIVHLSSLSGWLIPIPLMNVIAPVIVWQMKKDMPFVNDQGKETVNFQITIAIMVVVSVLLMLVLIGFVLIGLVILFSIVMTIIAAIKANDGEPYRYPLTIRFIK